MTISDQNPPHRHTLGDALHFASRFFTRPGSIGSIWPSSRQLGEAMLHEVPLNAGDVVVEYGPGTGPFTSVFGNACHPAWNLGIERDPELHRNLVRRFPGMRFHHGSAEETPEILSQHHLGKARLVLSGLPFANMTSDLQGRILRSTSEALHHDGIFRTFTYLLAALSPRTMHFRRLVGEHFLHHHDCRTVMKNFPPARVLSFSKPVKRG